MTYGVKKRLQVLAHTKAGTKIKQQSLYLRSFDRLRQRILIYLLPTEFVKEKKDSCGGEWRRRRENQTNTRQLPDL